MQACPSANLPNVPGVTNATISLIEQEAHAPSLASLHRILTAIPISIADFFALPATQKNTLFYDAEDLAVVTRGAADLRVLGSERRDKKLQLFIERYQPGAGTGDDADLARRRNGCRRDRGTIEVEVDGRSAGGHCRRRLPAHRQPAVSPSQCRPDDRRRRLRLHAAADLTNPVLMLGVPASEKPKQSGRKTCFSEASGSATSPGDRQSDIRDGLEGRQGDARHGNREG